MESKSLQSKSQNGFGRTLDEDIVSKVKKKKAESVGGPPGRLKVEVCEALGGGKQGGGKWLHTPDVPWTSQGVGGYCVTSSIQPRDTNQAVHFRSVVVPPLTQTAIAHTK